MEHWTPEHNTYLSCLLDDVIGTEEVVKMRQDYCKIWDCIKSLNRHKINIYYTGSKAEGLNLPGSDDDYMFDINNLKDTEVSESVDDLVRSTRTNKFLVVSENVPPGFAFLKCVSQLNDQHLLRSLITMNDNAYFGSNAYVSSSPDLVQKGDTRRMQGPSIEVWGEYSDTSNSGQDNVQSIHCKFWPSPAAEWINRPRQYGWPSNQVRDDIVAFGSHLVAVGHPLSANRSIQWRLSFSIAERMLVWSFNHTQIQCYAVMKLLLKEYIKVKCSQKHKDVLCSYFIKTFLFWQFETTDKSLWQTKNLIGCLIYVFREFHNSIKSGVLRHYFIPRFNLLEIKLTPEAQKELSMLFEYVVHYGISIFGQCASFANIFAKFCQFTDGGHCAVLTAEMRRHQILNTDQSVMQFLSVQILDILRVKTDPYQCSSENALIAMETLKNDGCISEPLSILTIRYLCIRIVGEKLYCCSQGNKSLYMHMKKLDGNCYGTDIATSKLWLATFLLYRGDYCTALQKVNDVLSSIPPYLLFYNGVLIPNDGSKRLYMKRYNFRTLSFIYRAKEAWLIDMHIVKKMHSYMPRAIQIELYYCDPFIGILVSPFTYAYYLMFLCYHGLRQYVNRDRTLRQLVDTVTDKERCSHITHTSYNVAGHCLLIAGQPEVARLLFLQSAYTTHRLPGSVIDKYNSAYHYLSYM